MTTENARTQTLSARTYSKSNSSRGIRASKLRNKYTIHD